VNRPPTSLIGFTLLTLILVITTFNLGLWQLKRLEWKEGILIRLSQDQNPRHFIPIEEFIVGFQTYNDPNFIRVKVRGKFLHNYEMALSPRTYNGQNGAHLLTPLILDHGGYVIVSRGWIPQEYMKNSQAPIDRPEGEVSFNAYTRKPDLPGWLTPDNVSQHKIWYYIDLEAIQEVLSKENQTTFKKQDLPFYVSIVPEQHPVESFDALQQYPIAIDPKTFIANKHLGYAWTWFGLCIVFIIWYSSYVMSYIRNKKCL
jgi:surfeit locus 1 family protein